MRARNVNHDVMTLCFDLQQVQPLPKLSIGEAFYKRQITLYAFCVTDPGLKNPLLYTWLESEAHRGAEEIASAVTHSLNQKKQQWLKNDVKKNTVIL